jgi:two-component system CheB/CheR fusion protein
MERPEVICHLSLSSQLFSSGGGSSNEYAATGGSALEDEAGRPRALIVDDAPDVTEMIALFLQHAGYETVLAYSAYDALEAAREASFDVVVSDIGMPGMNGYELAEELRRLPAYGGVPLIAVTGFSAFDDHGRALKSGFNAHLTKPINPMSLLELIRSLNEGTGEERRDEG